MAARRIGTALASTATTISTSADNTSGAGIDGLTPKSWAGATAGEVSIAEGVRLAETLALANRFDQSTSKVVKQ